jgi:hypothetical protein
MVGATLKWIIRNDVAKSRPDLKEALGKLQQQSAS